jgi:hypothetical protein
MSKIPAKATIKCKFEVHFTLSVPIEDMYASDRSIIEKLCGQYIFDQRDQDEDGNPTYGVDPELLREHGIEVVSAYCSSDPSPTGKQHTTRDWEIEIDEEEARRQFYGKELTEEFEAVIRTHMNAMQSATELSMRALNRVLNSLDLEVCKERSWQDQPEFYINDLQGSALGRADEQAFETPYECLMRFEHYVQNEFRQDIVELENYMSIHGKFAYEHWKICGEAGGLTYEDFVAYDRKYVGVPS